MENKEFDIFWERKASRVVRAPEGPVCLVEHHTGRKKFYNISHLDN